MESSFEPSPNEEQLLCITFPPEDLLIQAGPGTGKTFTLINRIAHMLNQGIPGQEILCLTFTRKAKRELESRLLNMVGPNQVEIYTFHGFSIKLLKEFGHLIGINKDFVLIRPEEIKGRKEGIYEDRPVTSLDIDDSEVAKVVSNSLKKGIISDSSILADHLEGLALAVLFLEELTIKKYISNFKYIFIDEFQDTSPIEIKILKRIREISNPIFCAIGDPNQSIYGFRGISHNNFDLFSTILGNCYIQTLKTNYRSQGKIIKAANGILKAQTLKPFLMPKEDIQLMGFHDPVLEARWVGEEIMRLMGGLTLERSDKVSEKEGYGFSDIAVLFRLIEMGQTLAEELSKKNIPTSRLSSERLVEIYPISVLYAYLRTVAYPDNPILREHYLSLIKPHGMGPVQPGEVEGMDVRELVANAIQSHGLDGQGPELDYVMDLARGYGQDLRGFLEVMAYEAASQDKGILGERVALLSIHASKGLEWEVVFLCGLEEGILPLTLFGETDLEEEKRLFYVGVTRAKARLYLTTCRQRRVRNRPLNLRPSSFLDMIPGDIMTTRWALSQKGQRVQLPLLGHRGLQGLKGGRR
jgi:superfamily I DNA/RNA helicase